MRKLVYILILVIPFVLISCRDKNPGFIVTCGNDEVSISDITPEVPVKIWSWSMEDSNDLPSSMKMKFLTMNECKPAKNSRAILITSSGGGVALVSIEDKSILFYANQPNAQSAEMLPGDRIAVVASHSPKGNRINIYDTGNPDVVIYTDSLAGAGGLVWDRFDKVLWVLGETELRKYSLESWKSNEPYLLLQQSFNLPGRGGLDINFNNESTSFIVSTKEGVWQFDKGYGKFGPYNLIGSEPNVLSTSFNKRSGETAYVKSSEDAWWAYYIRFSGSSKVTYIPYQHIVKARWLY